MSVSSLLSAHRPRVRAAEIETVADGLLYPGGESVHGLFPELCELAAKAFDHSEPRDLGEAEILTNPSTVPLMRYFLEALYRYRDEQMSGMNATDRRALISKSFGLSGSRQHVRSIRSTEAKTAYQETGLAALEHALEDGKKRGIAIRAAFKAMEAEYGRRCGRTGTTDPRTARRLRADFMKGLLRDALITLAPKAGGAG